MLTLLSVKVSVGILASSITLRTAALAGTCCSLEYAGLYVNFPSFMDCNSGSAVIISPKWIRGTAFTLP